MTLTYSPVHSAWQRWVRRSAAFSWRTLVVAAIFGLVAGTITATTGIGGERAIWPSPEYCPPLFYVIANLLYVLAILLSVPSLIVVLPAWLRTSWQAGLHHLLHGLAPVIVYLSFFEGSHYIGCTGVTRLCQAGSFTGHVHLLHHTVVGGLPLTVLFSLGFSWISHHVSAPPLDPVSATAR